MSSIYTVDSFTSAPFKGNPAGVYISRHELSTEAMQDIAKEINYSETAFVTYGDNPQEFNLRWFSPSTEVDICGHGTLAAAKVIYETGLADIKSPLIFHTKSGELSAALSDDGIRLDFPANFINAAISDSVIEKFADTQPLFVGTDRSWCLIELENDEQVRKIRPDFELLKTHTQQLFIFTAKSGDPQYDFVTRCFGPAIGVNEDPVTGSAHCYLATYWGGKLKKKKMKGFQASERTGSIVCEWIGNRVHLFGEAVIVFELKFFNDIKL
ncbi:phenazine biosynthesis protein PhzF family [Mucilaginibacter gossypiicola]|uniref:Phenazine biosynthesis protein PhzF family n=1 Tax=Mucilaginibacter gossypiicola TaxID=551995 RepID=A0A1H8D0C0_9SPHI|nr:PhzF family phenazine biosynthesis protein [Mucilaginibacter gossypiicola]SEN00710.1 phenazine biosynthesis protein PhzF family [Mucilaginibacter gossypiicola]